MAVELLGCFTEIPDVADAVLREPVERVFGWCAVPGDGVVDDGGAAARGRKKN